MGSMNDIIINVPTEDDDIFKEVKSLPRTMKNNGMVTVKLKRKMNMKNHHKMGLIRPEKIYEALLFLKQNHPEYKDINISDCDQWMQNLQNNDEETEADNSDGPNSECSDDEIEDENSNDENINSSNQNEENIFNGVTCLFTLHENSFIFNYILADF